MHLLASCAVAVGAAFLAFASHAIAQEQAVPPVVVRGTVVTMHGDPVAEATVEVRDERTPDKVVCTLRTDAAGAFASKRLPGGRTFMVRAHSATSSVAEKTVAAPPPPIQLVVFDGITLRGTLRAANGTPHAGVEVRALPWLEHCGDVVATTGADGAFLLPNLPRGRVRVVAPVPGLGMWTANHRAVGDEVLTLAPLVGQTRDVRLRVEGLPADMAAGTRVELRPTTFSGLPRAWERPQFDANGTCTLRGLPDWHYHVRLQRDGVHFEPAEATLRSGGVQTFRAHTAADSRELTVRVAGEGLPESGMHLVARTAIGNFVATRRDDGTFRISIAPSVGPITFAIANSSRVVVNGSDPDQVMRQATVASLRDGLVLPKAESTVHLEVAEQAHLEGVVQSSTGPPSAAVVWLEHKSPRETSFEATGRWQTTDARGHFAFGGLPPVAGTLRLIAITAHGEGWSREFPIPKAAQLTTVPPIAIEPFARIEGIVRNQHGNPAPGVRVRCRPYNLENQRLARSAFREVVSDGLGRYAIDAIPGHAVLLHTLLMEGDVSARACEPFATPPGTTTTKDLTVEVP